MEHGHKVPGVILLLDTCGERASVAVAEANGVALAQRVLGERAASTGLMEAIRSVLQSSSRRLTELDGIGVVSGPGSFTGVRVGLAVTKGLCEAAGLPMAAVSRLQVLAEAVVDTAFADGFCALSAGRDQVYARRVRGTDSTERLMRNEDLQQLRRGALVAVDTPELAARLAGGGPVQQVELTAFDALGPVMRELAGGGSDVALADANYVRDEGAIYRKAGLNEAGLAVAGER